MGSVFSMYNTLTDSQKEKAHILGISEDEMIQKILRINNMEKPNVSVIIPVFNCEKYIKYAIDSVLRQTYDSYELIVVDDGSTDGTLDIITEYDGITVLVKPNGGTSSALNTGIKSSKGNWIKWLSADDVLFDNYLEVMMKNARDDRINYCNYERINEYGEFIKNFIEPIERNNKTNKEQFDELMRYFYGNGSSSLIHKSIFDKIGLFDDSLKHSEDYDFWLKASKNGIIFELIPEILLKYRVHPEQLTNKVGGSIDEIIRSRYR